MKSENTNALILGTIIFLAVSRLLPHPNNFTPLGGIAILGATYMNHRFIYVAPRIAIPPKGVIAILGATYMNHRFMKYVVPIIAFYISDLLASNWNYSSFYPDTSFVWFSNHMLWHYGASLLIVGLSSLIMKKKN